MKELFIKKENVHPLLWALSPFIGIAVGYGVIGFRYAIDLVHWLWLDADMETLLAAAAQAPWWQVMAGPVITGLLAACVVRYLPPAGRPMGVADILISKDHHDERVGPAAGITSAAYAAVCLGGGGSAGRESPAIHLGVAITSTMTRFFALPASAAHVLFACGTGAAVAASFNAPIAGMLFAHEIILRHIALPAIMPIAIACASATAITRIHLGNFPAFQIPEYMISAYSELPTFALLGVICACVAVAFTVLTFRLTEISAKMPGPDWTRPIFVGLLTGGTAMVVPGVLGVGYEITDAALKAQLPLMLLLLLIPLKLVLTSVTLAGRFGGGVFSPTLYLGALTGAAFGMALFMVAPTWAGNYGLYAVAGMGGVSAAVLGAPISTILIAFELIGDYKVTLALMVTVTIATALSNAALGDGFFRLQAERLGLKTRRHRRII